MHPGRRLILFAELVDLRDRGVAVPSHHGDQHHPAPIDHCPRTTNRVTTRTKGLSFHGLAEIRCAGGETGGATHYRGPRSATHKITHTGSRSATATANAGQHPYRSCGPPGARTQNLQILGPWSWLFVDSADYLLFSQLQRSEEHTSELQSHV